MTFLVSNLTYSRCWHVELIQNEENGGTSSGEAEVGAYNNPSDSGVPSIATLLEHGKFHPQRKPSVSRTSYITHMYFLITLPVDYIDFHVPSTGTWLVLHIYIPFIWYAQDFVVQISGYHESCLFYYIFRVMARGEAPENVLDRKFEGKKTFNYDKPLSSGIQNWINFYIRLGASRGETFMICIE